MDTYDPLASIDAEEKSRIDEASRAQLASEVEAEDLTWLMNDKRGRRIVWRTLERAGVYRSSFSIEPMQMAFSEGTRNEGLRLLCAVQLSCAEQTQKMILEAQA